jgi:hypothetical protein
MEKMEKKMQTQDLTPLLIDVIIQFLDTRPIGTKYHPKKNEYIIDTRLMARVIRHNGNLMARVDHSENVFFSQLLSYLVKERTVSSSIHMGKYYCEAIDGYTRLLVRVKKLGIFSRLDGFQPLIENDKNELKENDGIWA